MKSETNDTEDTFRTQLSTRKSSLCLPTPPTIIEERRRRSVSWSPADQKNNSKADFVPRTLPSSTTQNASVYVPVSKTRRSDSLPEPPRKRSLSYTSLRAMTTTRQQQKQWSSSNESSPPRSKDNSPRHSPRRFSFAGEKKRSSSAADVSGQCLEEAGSNSGKKSSPTTPRKNSRDRSSSGSSTSSGSGLGLGSLLETLVKKVEAIPPSPRKSSTGSKDDASSPRKGFGFMKKSSTGKKEMLLANLSSMIDPSKHVTEWSTEEVCVWVWGLSKLSKSYVEPFRKQKINGKLLIELDRELLQSRINMYADEDIDIMMTEIRELRDKWNIREVSVDEYFEDEFFLNSNDNNSSSSVTSQGSSSSSYSSATQTSVSSTPSTTTTTSSQASKRISIRMSKEEAQFLESQSLTAEQNDAILTLNYDWEELNNMDMSIKQRRTTSRSRSDSQDFSNLRKSASFSLKNSPEEKIRTQLSRSPLMVFQLLQTKHQERQLKKELAKTESFDSGSPRRKSFLSPKASPSSTTSSEGSPAEPQSVPCTPTTPTSFPPSLTRTFSNPERPASAGNAEEKRKKKKNFFTRTRNLSFSAPSIFGGHRGKKSSPTTSPPFSLSPEASPRSTPRSRENRSESMSELSLPELYLENTTIDYRVFLFDMEDTPDVIVFEPELQDGRKVVRGASLEKLVQRLTYHKHPDPDFVMAFFLAYRRFTTPQEVLTLLTLRYNTPPPKNMTIEEFKGTLIPIRLRIFNVLKVWVNHYFSDFANDPKLLEAVLEFCNGMSKTGMESAAISLRKLIEVQQNGGKQEKQHQFDTLPKKPHIPRNLKSLKFVDLHPEEVARQLTIMQSKLFRAIGAMECIDQNWMSPQKETLSPNIIAMIRHFNKISNWVSTEIVKIEDVSERAITLNRFVIVAEKCLQLNNFNGVMEILSSLLNQSINRLRHTWELIPLKSWESYQKMVKLMNGDSNFQLYRKTLHSVTPPCIPYLGVYLTDLTFLEDGNPNTIPDSSLINFGKIRMIASVIREIQTYQQTPYCIEEVPVIQEFMQNQEEFSEEDLWRHSLLREPLISLQRRYTTIGAIS